MLFSMPIFFSHSCSDYLSSLSSFSRLGCSSSPSPFIHGFVSCLHPFTSTSSRTSTGQSTITMSLLSFSPHRASSHLPFLRHPSSLPFSPPSSLTSSLLFTTTKTLSSLFHYHQAYLHALYSPFHHYRASPLLSFTTAKPFLSSSFHHCLASPLLFFHTSPLLTGTSFSCSCYENRVLGRSQQARSTST